MSQNASFTEDMIPPKLKVLKFEPDRLLKLALPMPGYIGVRSFCIYAATVSLVATLLIKLVDPSWLFAAAFAIWAYQIKRGIVLTIDLSKGRYFLRSPLERRVRAGPPAIEIRTAQQREGFSSTLVIAGYDALICTATDREKAESLFLPFLRAFSPSDNGQTFAATDRPKAIASPLILLVHGTWGCYSSWAIPERSNFVKALTNELPYAARFRRFPWSGGNSARARSEAAERLAKHITNQLARSRRAVFVVSHSHGGNIAMRAFALLTEAERASVRNVFLSTPFLSSGMPFDVRLVFNSLPETLKSNLRNFLLTGVWFTSLSLVGFVWFALTNGAQLPGVIGAVEWWQFPLVVFLFFGPVMIFDANLGGIRARLAELPSDAGRTVVFDHSRPLVIAHAQDEAFQALSFAINVLSLAHHLLLTVIIGCAWLARKSRLLDILFQVIGTVSYIAFLFCFALIPAGMIASVIGWVFPSALPAIQSAWDLLPRKPFDQIFMPMVAVSISSAIVVGAAIIMILLIVLVTALARMLIFSGIGVLDQMLTKREFLSAVLGTVSISMIPPGCSESMRLEGRTLFNHGRVYDDSQAIARIGEYINAYVNPRDVDLTR